MKAGIHPAYNEVNVICACGSTFKTRSTHKGDIHLEICSNCHPFFTGKQKLLDTAGRIERFRPALGPGIRVDTFMEDGASVPPFYDSMIAKLVVWAEDRHAAIERALSGGVPRVHVISYAQADSLLLEVFTNEGTGTLVVNDTKNLRPEEQAG